MREIIRKIIDNAHLNFGIGLTLWLTSTAGQELFWSDMMSAEMEVNHGVALLGAWRAVKYLPDVVDSLL